MLDKKQIWAIFLLKFKMDHKAVETTCNISNAFGSGTANVHIGQWCFKKFCKGDESLEDEECNGRPSKVNKDQLRGASKLILLQLHKKLLKNSMWTTLWSFGIYSKLERWKNQQVGASWANDKSECHCFEVSSSLILCNNSEPFFNQIVTCDEKWIL